MKQIIIDGKIFTYQESSGKCQALNRATARELLLKIKEVFDANNLLFTLSFGTLLGAIRDKDFIKGDEDIDVFISDEEKLISLIPILWEKDIKIFRHKKEHIYSFQYKDTNCYIDCYIMIPYKFSIWGISCLRIHKWAIPKKYFRNYEYIDFLEQKFRVPQNPINLLQFWYGDTWNIPISKRSKKYRYEIYPAYICHYTKKQILKIFGYLFEPATTLKKIKKMVSKWKK